MLTFSPSLDIKPEVAGSDDIFYKNRASELLRGWSLGLVLGDVRGGGLQPQLLLDALFDLVEAGDAVQLLVDAVRALFDRLEPLDVDALGCESVSSGIDLLSIYQALVVALLLMR